MDELKESLIAAQVAYYKRKCLSLDVPLLKSEWMGCIEGFLQRPLCAIFPQAILEAHLTKMCFDAGLPQALRGMTTQWLIEQHQALQDSEWVWQDVLSEDWFIMVSGRIAEQSALRDILISQVLDSEVYRQLVSDLLYEGIRSFFQQESLLGKMPALGSLFKLGRLGLGKMAPGIEEWVSPLAKTFIGFYVETALTVSKDSLIANLNEERIREFSKQLWIRLSEASVAQGVALLDLSDLEKKLHVGEENWQNVRNQEGTQAILSQGIQGWVEKLMRFSAKETLVLAGVDEAVILDLLLQALQAFFQHLDDAGHLDTYLRQMIRPVYESPEMTDLLAALG